MKENSNSTKLFRNILVVLCIVIILGIAGFIYAHINGVETIISPLLRNLRITSKYEDSDAKIDDEKVTKNNITVKLLDGVIDDTSLIISSNINIDDIKDSWIEINGIYKINDLQVDPINTMIDKISNSEFVCYQVFNINKIDIKDKQNVKMNVNISEIKEFNEVENEDSVYSEYGKSYTDGWNFEKNISTKNLEDEKEYKFENPEVYKTEDNINISATEFITSFYSNILEIKTDKTNYKGNSFEKYYKILDEQKNEIATYREKGTEYDHRVYNDRLLLNNIDRNSKIFIEVYLKEINKDNFSKVLEIPVNLADMIEKIEEIANLKEYKNNNYTIQYKENWNLIPEVDTNRVGPNSSYLGALELEIPSTTNPEYTSSIYIKVTDENTTIENLAKKIRENNKVEYFEEKIGSETMLKNQKAYTIVTETTDGEENYIKQDIFTTVNGKSYIITFFGSEKEYDNLKTDINEFVKNFEI